MIAALLSILIAAPVYGYDVLGVAKYCSTYLRAPQLPAVSTLMGTFGDPLPCIEQRIQQGGLTDVQIDLIDGTCWRNKNCEPGVPRPDDKRAIKARAAQVSALSKKYSGVTFWLSPVLEHDIKDAKTVVNNCAIALSACSTCQCINSPFSGAKPPQLKLELHGNETSAYSVSNDGASLFDSNSVRYRQSGTNYVYAWFPEMNLRYSGEKTFTPPSKRTCKPSAELFKQAYLLLQEPEAKVEAPSVCESTRDVTSDEIWKTNAESYCNDDVRGNKPLYISKLKGSRYPIISKTGTEIACIKLYGSYSGKPGYNRHYVGSCSGESPTKLYEEAGGEWAFIRDSKRCIRVNTIRRLGSFR